MRKQKVSKKRRNYSLEFIAKIALSAIKGYQSFAEIAPDREPEIKPLQAKIDEITMSNYFLSKALIINHERAQKKYSS